MSERLGSGDVFDGDAPQAPETPRDEVLRPATLVNRVYGFAGYHGAESACRLRIFGGAGRSRR